MSICIVETCRTCKLKGMELLDYMYGCLYCNSKTIISYWLLPKCGIENKNIVESKCVIRFFVHEEHFFKTI